MQATIFLTKEEVKNAIEYYILNSFSYLPIDSKAITTMAVDNIQFFDEVVTVGITCEKE